MRERRRLDDMRNMTALDKVRRAEAHAAMIDAAEVFEASTSATEHARDDVARSEDAWLDQVRTVGHDPAAARWFAARLIQDIATLQSTEAKAERDRITAQKRRQDWSGLEARVRQDEREVARLGVRLANRRDEKRTQALADRITATWRPS